MAFLIPFAPYVGGAAAALAATVYGTKKVGSYVEEKKADASGLLDRAHDLIASAPVQFVDAAKMASKKEFAKLIHAFIGEAEKQIPDAISEQSSDIAELFTLNAELKELLEEPVTGLAVEELNKRYDALFQRFSHVVENSEIQLHGFSLSTKPRVLAPTIEELHGLLSEKEEEEAGASIHELNHQFRSELRQLCICLRRHAEIHMVFGSNVPQELQNKINAASEASFTEEFNKAIDAKVDAENNLLFLGTFRTLYLKIVKFFTGMIAGHALLTFNSMLLKTKSFILTKDQSWIMDFLSKIFFEGLDLYTNAIINSADEIVHDRAHRDGNISMLIDARLKAKTSLRAGFATQQEFYDAALDFFLQHAYSWSISRFVMKKLITKTNMIDSLSGEIQKATHDANGYQHTIDKNIISFVRPLLAELKTPKAEDLSEDLTPKKAPRSYSELNKEKLKNGIKSLFKAVELTQASNLQELAATFEKGTKTPNLLSIDAILAQTAEAGAVSALRSLQNIINHKFLLQRMVEVIRATNHSFSASAPVSEEEMERVQNQRIEILNELTQAVIHKTVDQAPILNSDLSNDLLNEKISILKQKGEEYYARLLTLAEEEKLPKEQISEALDELQALRQNMEENAHSLNFSSTQKDLLLEPINVMQKTFESFILSFKEESTEAVKAALTKTLSTYKTNLEGSAFAMKGHVSILTSPVKRIAKVGLQLLLQDKFNKAYVFAWDPKTTRYLAVHQTFAALLKS